MKKLIIAALFILFLAISVSGQENKKFKAHEFQICGVIDQNFFLNYFWFDENSNALMDDLILRETSIIDIGQSAGTGLSAGYIFYFNNYFGLGFNILSRFDIKFINGYIFNYFDLINSIKIANKIGNTQNGKSFLLEYGLTACCYFLYSAKVLFLLGPNLYLAYDHRINKNLSFAVGGNFDFLFNTENQYTSDAIRDIYRGNSFKFHYICGIEFRLGFTYIKEIN